jgi:hypothetical protein
MRVEGFGREEEDNYFLSSVPRPCCVLRAGAVHRV